MTSRARLLVLGAISCVLLATTASVANPGGNGDADRDYTCGGSCHGDPSLSMPSDGTVSLSADTVAFSGTATAVHVTASGMSLSGKRLVGVFLLGSLNGNGDQPSDHGWGIIQDPNGGTSNYVETVVPQSGSVTMTWVLRAPSQTGQQYLYASMHHGSDPNPDGLASLGASQAASIDVRPVPENYPGLAEGWTAPENRVTGDDAPVIVRTTNTDQLVVLWRLEGEWATHTADVESLGGGAWAVNLPATIGETRLQYQITTHNGSFAASQPWLTVGTTPPAFDATLLGARLQALAFASIVFGFMVSLQARLSPRGGEGDEATPEVDSQASLPEPEPAKDDYWSRLVPHDDHPGWLWDPVEEEWVADPQNPLQGGGA